MEILIGIVCGVLLSLIFSVGPAFFSLIQNSIHHGYKKAVWYAVGVSVSDIVVVSLILTVLSNVNMNALLHNIWVGSIGGLAIGIFGVRTFRCKTRKETRAGSRLRFQAEQATSNWQLVLSGLLMNGLNPLIWVYWVTIITFLSAEMDLTLSARYLFFCGMLLASLATDIAKCRLAAMMQTFFTARRMNLFNKLMGSILIAFALYLVISMVLYQTNPRIRAKEGEKKPQSTRIIQTLHNHMMRDTAKGTASGQSAALPSADSLTAEWPR